VLKQIQIEGDTVSVEENGEIKINNKSTGIVVGENNTYHTVPLGKSPGRDRSDLTGSLENAAIKLMRFMP